MLDFAGRSESLTGKHTSHLKTKFALDMVLLLVFWYVKDLGDSLRCLQVGNEMMHR